jgi:hypothetical protein
MVGKCGFLLACFNAHFPSQRVCRLEGGWTIRSKGVRDGGISMFLPVLFYSLFMRTALHEILWGYIWPYIPKKSKLIYDLLT